MAKSTGGAPSPADIVTVYESGGVCLVDMRKHHTKKGNTIAFQNSTSDLIHIFFPEGELFAELSGQRQVIEIQKGQTSKAFKVKGDQPGKRDNHYPCAVFCAATGEFAIANSNPEIIIDF